MKLNGEILPALGLIAVSVVTSVAGQTVIKLGLRHSPALNGAAAVIGAIAGSPLVLLGLGLYAVGALVWIAVLSRVDLSFAYPFVALNFILVTAVSRFVLDEPVPLARWLGLGLICLGVLGSALGGSGADGTGSLGGH